MLKMFRISFLLLLVSVLFISSGCSKPDAHDAFDNPIYLSDLQGKWVLLNYWADWCKPCQQEIPVLNHLSKTYEKQVAILAINFDQLPQDKLQQFVNKHGIQISHHMSRSDQ